MNEHESIEYSLNVENIYGIPVQIQVYAEIISCIWRK